MERTELKDICVRSVKTFVQAFLGTLAVSVATVSDLNAVKAALIAAAAAGIAAVMNAIIELIKSRN